MNLLGKSLIFIGAVLILLGTFFLFAPHLPGIGKLPGDVHIEKKSFTFYFPLTTCILISAILSLIFWPVARR